MLLTGPGPRIMGSFSSWDMVIFPTLEEMGICNVADDPRTNIENTCIFVDTSGSLCMFISLTGKILYYLFSTTPMTPLLLSPRSV